MKRKQRFNIIVIAEDVLDYVFIITRQSPKKLRGDIIPLLRSYATQTLEFIIRANLLERNNPKRLEYQEEAIIRLNVLTSISYMCKRNNYITFHQLDVLGDKTFKLEESIHNWIKSDKELLS